MATIKLQSAAKVKESIKDLPRLPDGTVYSVFPPASEHVFDDPFWWNAAGQDIIDQRYIFEDYTGPEQTEELKEKLIEVFDEFPHYKQRVLNKAAEAGVAPVVRAMLEMGVKAGGKEERKKKDPEELEQENHGSDYEDEKDDIYTPLHDAALEGHLECVKILVEQGNMDVNQRDHNKATPLLYAARKAPYEVVKWLLDHGSDPTIVGDGPNIIGQCVSSKDLKKLKLFENNAQLHEAKIRIDNEVLGYAARAGNGNMEMLRYILQNLGYPPVDLENPDPATFPGENLTREQKLVVEEALIGALANNLVDATTLLFSYLSPRDPANPEKFQYYQVIDNWNCIGIVNYTEDAAEKDIVPIMSLVATSIFTTPPPHVQISSLADNQANPSDWLHRRLISASSYGALEVTRLLIEEHNADINHLSHKYHATPLLGAAAQGYDKVVEYLLSRGADIQLGCGTYANGPTALHTAVRNGHESIVKRLLAAGGPVEEFEQESADAVMKEDNFVVVAVDALRAPVYLFSEEKFKKWKTEESGGKDSKYTSVTLEVDDEIRKWIGDLQMRKRDELLKESGESARELMSKENSREVQIGAAKEGKIESGELRPPLKRNSTDEAYEDWLIAVGLSPPRDSQARRRHD